MRESRTIHLNADDLTALRHGQPLLIEGADGHPLLRIEWDGAKRRAPAPTPDTTDGAKSTNPWPAQKCPYCDEASHSLKSHIYSKHPGKSLSPSGPKCRYCPKRFGNDTAVMRHEVRAHPRAFRSRVSGKPSAKLQAKVNAKANVKEAPHA
jgi:hypothetical protein